jgi:hypothetical protein
MNAPSPERCAIASTDRPQLRSLSVLAALAALAGLSALAGPAGPAAAAPGGAIVPARFSTTIDNPFLPFPPGTRMVYRTVDGADRGREVVQVTHRTRLVDGVRVRVVRDRAYLAGSLVEDTRDFYAQDRQGNVWYFGERTAEIDHGRAVSTEGSWLAGRNGAKPGIVMEARPRVGDTYAQEDAPGVGEDRARVLSLDGHATVPFGSFTHLLKTKDFSPLEPSVVEHKKYLRNVGSILEKEVRGGTERLALIRVTRT